MQLSEATGHTIRRLRTEQGKSLRDIPFIAIGYLSEVERGQKDPSSLMMETIAKGLEISVSTLLKEIYEELESHNS